jgi:two-component system alkaline phosphatase synthesis response regulator PhoP
VTSAGKDLGTLIPKILLVDDVNMFLDLQMSYLKLSSVHVLTARDGIEAIQVIRTELPALVFMDLHMPMMDGAECCARLKADPELRKIPVVMVASEGKREEREQCFKAGCDDFLTKPLDRVQFLETARRHLPAIDRRDCRVPCRARVKFRAYGVTLSGEVRDVATNGIYVVADYDVDVGTFVDVAFGLPDRGLEILAKGRVAWLNSRKWRRNSNLPAGFGIEFVALDEEAKAALMQFVEDGVETTKKPA